MSKKITHQDFLNMINFDDHPYIKENLILCSQYTRAKDTCYIRNKYGLLKTTFDGLKYLNKTDISMAVDKTSYFIEELKERNPKLFELGFELVSEYESDRKKMTIKDKNGVLFKIQSSGLKQGRLPDIRSAVCKRTYKTFFKNEDKKLGFTKKWWCDICAKKEYSVLYFIECTSEKQDEAFLKVGLTCDSYKKRYDSKSKMPYNKKAILIIKDKSPDVLWDIERYIKSKYENYVPNIHFQGSLTECFPVEFKESIKTDIIEFIFND